MEVQGLLAPSSGLRCKVPYSIHALTLFYLFHLFKKNFHVHTVHLTTGLPPARGSLMGSGRTLNTSCLTDGLLVTTSPTEGVSPASSHAPPPRRAGFPLAQFLDKGAQGVQEQNAERPGMVRVLLSLPPSIMPVPLVPAPCLPSLWLSSLPADAVAAIPDPPLLGGLHACDLR